MVILKTMQIMEEICLMNESKLYNMKFFAINGLCLVKIKDRYTTKLNI